LKIFRKTNVNNFVKIVNNYAKIVNNYVNNFLKTLFQNTFSQSY